MTLEQLKNDALAALRLSRQPYSSHHFPDGRQLFVKAYGDWVFDFILDGERVSEIDARDAFGARTCMRLQIKAT